MDVQLTVVDTATGATADLRATAPPTARAHELLAALRTAVGAPHTAVVRRHGRPLIDDGAVADCPLADGDILTIGVEPARAPAGCRDGSGDPVLILAAAGGPDSGRLIRLGRGTHTVGRGPECDLRLHDPAVSRQHVRVTRNGPGVTVTDLGSANGVAVGGKRLAPGDTVELVAGSRAWIGGGELRLVELSRAASGVTAETAGPCVIRRAPRLGAEDPPACVEFPPAPVPPPKVRLPVVAALAPLAVGVALALVLHQWQLLAFTALSPLMIGGQAIGDRWHQRRTMRIAAREHSLATAAAEHQLAEALTAERRLRHHEAPDLATIAVSVTARGPLLWQRTVSCPDLMRLRLGRGDLAASVRVTGRPAPVLDGVPVSIDLRATPVFGLCGPAEATRGLVRALVVQAAALHPPDQLRIVVLGDGLADEWAWVRWLPHLAPRRGEASALIGLDDEQIARRVDELVDAIPDSRDIATLVIVDLPGAGRRARSLARLEALSGDGAGDLAVIWRADHDTDLPRTCAAVARLSTAGEGRLELQRAGLGERLEVIPDLMADDVAEGLSRAMSPLRAGADQASGELPRVVEWRAHNGVDLRDLRGATRALLRRWSLGPTTEIVLGVGVDGPVAVDLRLDGPHALVAGTTGSGKSELLLGLVAGLVASNRPDQLSLLLLDHKGGATFAACAKLPHTVAVLTDLDRASTRRALLSLGAEVRRREARLAAAGAVDLESYLALAGEPEDPLPRLVIVVDEFAALAEEQPEFVGGLVAIAQRGRSLGLHLVLATQRPEGVVSADIRANTRLRICLGVARAAESRDVIDSPAAAAISRQTPGRAYLRIGPGELRAFQSGRVAARHSPSVQPAVTLLPAAVLGSTPPASPVASRESSDLDVLIEAAVAADHQLSCRRPPPPWLPPLPEFLELSGPSAGPTDSVSWGLADLPALGEQRRVRLDLTVGATTVIAGTSRSGRTTAALTVAVAAARHLGPADLHLWAVDAAAGLSPLARLPHCGAVVPAHETERVGRLLRSVTAEVADRRRRPRGGDRPMLMLVVDSWEAIATATGPDGARLADELLELAADGPAAGLHLVIAADRAGLTGRLSAVASERIVLRLADPGDLAMIGVALRDAPRDLPPGRGVRASDQALVQLAAASQDNLADARRWPAAERTARRFDPLPDRVQLDEIAAPTDRPGIVLGLQADSLDPVVIEATTLANGFLVAGPSGSGRTSALMLLAGQLTSRRRLVCCRPGSPLLAGSDVVHLPPEDQLHALALLDAIDEAAGPLPHLLVDDLDQLGDGPLQARLDELARPRGDPGRGVIVAGLAEALNGAFRGPAARIRLARTGLLLCPSSPSDGDLLGLRLARPGVTPDPPGRGWLAVKGHVTRLQLATSGPPVANRPDEPAVPHRYPSTELELSRLGARSRE